MDSNGVILLTQVLTYLCRTLASNLPAQYQSIIMPLLFSFLSRQYTQLFMLLVGIVVAFDRQSVATRRQFIRGSSRIAQGLERTYTPEVNRHLGGISITLDITYVFGTYLTHVSRCLGTGICVEVVCARCLPDGQFTFMYTFNQRYLFSSSRCILHASYLGTQSSGTTYLLRTGERGSKYLQICRYIGGQVTPAKKTPNPISNRFALPTMIISFHYLITAQVVDGLTG